MTARYFVDENDLALAKALAERYADVVYPGHPDLPEVPGGHSMIAGSKSSADKASSW